MMDGPKTPTPAMERFRFIAEQIEKLNVDKLRRHFPHCEESVSKLEAVQGHTYRNRKTALASLIHRSSLVYWPNDKSGIFSNEKLEYLGDSFLNFFVATEAMAAHPEMNEGQLSKLRAAIVGTESLSRKARDLGLGELLLLGKGEALSHGQKRQNALADAFESVTAALLLDAGEDGARRWLFEIFAADFVIGEETLAHFDVKTRFQQWTQGIVGRPPTYKVVGTIATPQITEFIVGGFVGDTELARASAPSKRDASKLVAAKMQVLVDRGELTPEMLTRLVASAGKRSADGTGGSPPDDDVLD
jgi:ribonuclease-3